MRTNKEIVKALQVHRLLLTQINPNRKDLRFPLDEKMGKEWDKERYVIGRIIDVLTWVQGENDKFEELLQAWYGKKNW